MKPGDLVTLSDCAEERIYFESYKNKVGVITAELEEHDGTEYKNCFWVRWGGRERVVKVYRSEITLVV